MFAIADTERFSIVTVADAVPGASASPAWAAMFGWPAAARDTVPLAVRSPAERKIWAARLDHAVRAADRAVLLVADGMGCAASAWWARLSPAQDVTRIAGALMFAPRDDAALFAAPAAALPFPSLVIAPRDGRAAGDAAAAIAAAIASWGARIVDAPAMRGAAEAGAWRQAQRLFLRLTAHVAQQEVARAEALFGTRG